MVNVVHMPPFALDELPKLLASTSERDLAAPAIRYVCALFAELAYHHVPQWEIDDDQRRAKVIPCAAYRTLVRRGRAAEARRAFGENENVTSFVVEDRGTIAVGARINDLTIVGFRGTKYLYDWRVNARLRRTTRPGRYPGGGADIHSGFAEEATRIARLVGVELARVAGKGGPVLFTGHSLGGAIAAIAAAPSRRMTYGDIRGACILGAPRYGGVASLTWSEVPILSVQREGDVVPFVPPRVFGYVDHGDAIDVAGRRIYSSELPHGLRESAMWLRFMAGRFRPHDICEYRREMGLAAQADLASAQLTDFDKL